MFVCNNQHFHYTYFFIEGVILLPAEVLHCMEEELIERSAHALKTEISREWELECQSKTYSGNHARTGGIWSPAAVTISKADTGSSQQEKRPPEQHLCAQAPSE